MRSSPPVVRSARWRRTTSHRAQTHRRIRSDTFYPGAASRVRAAAQSFSLSRIRRRHFSPTSLSPEEKFVPAADTRPSLRLRAVRTPGRMAPSGKQVGQLGLVAAAFLAGRWTHSSGAGSPPQAALSDVAPEERHLLYTPPAGHGAVKVSLTLTRSLIVARSPP